MPPKPDWLARKIAGAVRSKRSEDALAERGSATRADGRKRGETHPPKSPGSGVIAVIDEDLAAYAPFTKAFHQRFTRSGELGDSPSDDGEAVEDKHTYGVVARHIVPKMIYWAISSSNFNPIEPPDYLTTCALLMPNPEFISAVLRSDDGVDFEEVKSLVAEWLGAINTKGRRWRIVLIFTDLNVPICKAQRKIDASLASSDTASMSSINVSHWVEQACLYLSMELGVETVRCSKYADLADHLHHMTRALSNAHRHGSCAANTEHIMKASKRKPDAALSEDALRQHELRQTWCAMLQMLPLLSQEKAHSFTSQAEYSCPKKVYEFIQREKENSVAYIKTAFGTTKTGAVRNEQRLATIVYNSMTAEDPSQTI